LEKSWWATVDLPKQNRAEAIPDFILRVCSTVEKLRVPANENGAAFKETEAEKEDRVERINGESETYLHIT